MACWRRGLTHQPFTLAFTGSNPVHVIPGRLAQLGERLPYKQNVGGSIPSTPIFYSGAVVQMVRMPACHAGGRGFDSHLRRSLICRCSSIGRAADL